MIQNLRRLRAQFTREMEEELLACGDYPTVQTAAGETRLVDTSGWLFVGRRTLSSSLPYFVPPLPGQIEAAAKVLRDFEPQPIQTKSGRICSYSLKHTVEQLAGDYVSNGACIVACHQVGLKLFDFSRTELNANVAVSKKWFSIASRAGYQMQCSRLRGASA